MSKMHFGLGLVLGAFLGAGATYFLTRDDLDKELSERDENIRKYYKEKYEKELKEATEAMSNDISSSIDVESEEDPLFKYDKVLLDFDYSAVHDKSSETKKEEKEEVKPPAEEPSPKKTDAPYPISQAEYEDESNGYFKEEYTYYYADEIIVNNRGKRVDIEPIGGDDTLRLLRKKDASDVYIRNDELEMDFYIAIDFEN